MNRRTPSRRRGGCGCFLILLLLVVVGIAVAAEIGARWYLGDRVEQQASEQLGAPVSANLPRSPILPGLVIDRSVDSVQLTSPGSDALPRLDVTARTTSLVDGAVHAASADGTATLSSPQLTALAQANNDGAGDPIEGLAEIRSIHPDVSAGLLRADIGGIAEIGVEPGVTDGQLTLTPQQTSLLGFPLPDGLFSGITGTVDSTIAALPDGLRIDNATVVDDGLEVRLSGTDVAFR